MREHSLLLMPTSNLFQVSQEQKNQRIQNSVNFLICPNVIIEVLPSLPPSVFFTEMYLPFSSFSILLWKVL